MQTVSSLRDSRSRSTLPGTAVPGFHMTPLTRLLFGFCVTFGDKTLFRTETLKRSLANVDDGKIQITLVEIRAPSGHTNFQRVDLL